MWSNATLEELKTERRWYAGCGNKLSLGCKHGASRREYVAILDRIIAVKEEEVSDVTTD